MSKLGRCRCTDCQRIRVRWPRARGADICKRCWYARFPEHVYVEGRPGEKGRVMKSAWARRQLGRSKGAQVINAKGLGHRWNSDTARAANRAYWKKVKRAKDGRVLGRPAKPQRLDRANLRHQYTNIGAPGVWYSPVIGAWVDRPAGRGQEPAKLSENVALRRLGHLNPTRNYVPGPSQGRSLPTPAPRKEKKQ